jgi:phosphate-selective porin OprO and OprP
MKDKNRQQACALAFALYSGLAIGQATESLSEPIGVVGGDAPAAPAQVDYAVPDLPFKPAPGPEQQNAFFTLRPSFAYLEDFTYIDQDDNSIAQVGDQASQWQLRSARLSFLGTFGRDYKVNYQLGGEYQGLDSEPGEHWTLTDLALTFPLGGPQNKLIVGKTKEPFAYEMVGDSANLPQSERVLSPFFVSRNMGAKMLHVFGEQKRMTLSYGLFNDSWDINSTTSRGTDYAARASGLLWDVPDNAQFLHLGLALRHVAADGTVRYRGRPESNITDYYVDTGNIAAEGAFQYGIEALWNNGPVSLLAEYNHASVDSPGLDDPEFQGYYLTGSWVITGETRPYDRNVGYARRVIPAGRWGAPELVARYSHIDLDDGSVQGGSFEKTYLGLNWWATKRWKFGLGWSRTWLDKDGMSGVTDAVLSRIQWVY